MCSEWKHPACFSSSPIINIQSITCTCLTSFINISFKYWPGLSQHRTCIGNINQWGLMNTLRYCNYTISFHIPVPHAIIEPPPTFLKVLNTADSVGYVCSATVPPEIYISSGGGALLTVSDNHYDSDLCVPMYTSRVTWSTNDPESRKAADGATVRCTVGDTNKWTRISVNRQYFSFSLKYNIYSITLEVYDAFVLHE